MNQVSNISVPESRLLIVQVWDDSLVNIVENSIRNSNLGLNPMIEGSLIRIPIPELSEERIEIVKLLLNILKILRFQLEIFVEMLWKK